METPAHTLVVKVTSGPEGAERLSQAFTVAATALSSGIDVSLWLTGEASWMAVPGRAEQFELPYAAELAELRDALIEGGRVTLCTQCAARRELDETDLVDGIVIRGSAAFVEEVMGAGTRTLVY
jgi:predicted peroxiredoxin